MSGITFSALDTLGTVSCYRTDAKIIYKKCFALVTENMVGHRIAELFEMCNIHSVEDLQKRFSEVEIGIIYDILERYFLLTYGSADLSHACKLLNISSIIEVLNPDNDFIKRFTALFERSDKSRREYADVLVALEAYVKIAFSSQKIIKRLELTSVCEYSHLLVIFYQPLEALTFEERARVAFFVMLSLSFIDQYSEKRAILCQVDHWRAKFSPAMLDVLNNVHLILSKVKALQYPSHKVETPPPQFRFVKPAIGALPNCIPHAANSCYMAATLTPLAFVCDAQIKEALKKYDHMTVPSDAVAAARENFQALYFLLKAEECTDITIAQVDALRQALQRAYDYRYFNPHSCSQEDAGDFLMCLVEDLLPMYGSKHLYVKHTFQQLASSTQIEPERYDYTAALATKYLVLEQNMTDISFEYKTVETLSNLATGMRRTNDIDLNAYLRDASDTAAAKYQTIMAEHQEQFLVESAADAPDFFCVRLRRFSQNPATGARTKHQTPIIPSRSLQFQIKGKEESNERVSYELSAITVHSGPSADGGHYYCYLLHGGTIYKYNDLTGAEAVIKEAAVWQDVLINGYIFYFKKIG